MEKLRILLVEGHEDAGRALARLLEMQGHVVCRAARYAAAVCLCGEQSFDLLISGLDLPDGSGLDLMRHLAARCGAAGIALTGGQPEDATAARVAGFAATLTRPLVWEDVVAALRAVGPAVAAEPGAPGL